MRKKIYIGALGLLIARAQAQTSAFPPGVPFTTATIRGVVSYEPSKEIFRYVYTVTNSRESVGRVNAIYIDISTSSLGVALSGADLINSATGYFGGIASVTSMPNLPQQLQNAANIQSTKFRNASVPVGFASQPPGWHSGPTSQLTAGWSSPRSPGSPIAPGESLTGFVLTSHGLPGIRRFTVKPVFNPWKFFSSGQGIDDGISPGEAQQNNDLARAIQQAIVSNGYTIGPVQPPSLTDPNQLITFLAALARQSIELRWVCGAKFINEMNRLLEDASDSLSKGKSNDARDDLQRLINLISNQRGIEPAEFFDRAGDHEGDDRARVTSNAYYMLTADAEYTLSLIPEAKRGDR